ncbi:MAG: CehA/McbA family metallohydrolase [Thermoleophilia bacterium]|nr:CehA/McbA family metallohydrolase [Thermoleophilia bacterium]
MPGSLFREDGMWLRCQFHAHTTNSDGAPLPAALCDHYADVGFDVLAITDHWHVTDVDHDGIVVIPSSELTAVAHSAHDEAEVLALGVAELPEAMEPFPTIEALAAWIVERGGVPFLCHPYWSGLRAEDVLAAPSLAGIEIWNGGSEVMHGNGLSTVQWDDVLQQGRMVMGIATDDCHTPGEDSGFGWTWVLAAERSVSAVIHGLRTGRFYASAGPKIRDVVIEETAVTVRCSPARSVRLRSGPWDGCAVNAELGMGDWRGEVRQRDGDGLITVARFEFPEFWRWARVEVEDERGRRAWSNGFVLPGELPARA